MRRTHLTRLFGAVLLLGTLASCVHVEENQSSFGKAPLFVTRGPYETRLTWDSESGYLYTIMMASDRKLRDWEPLPGASNLPGTGASMSVVDSHAQRSTKKHYRIVKLPIKKSKR